MLPHRRKWFYAASVLVLVGLVVFWTLVDRPAAADEPQDQRDSQRLREICELRDATSKTFELADGKREWVGYADAVHYRDAGGVWQEIDNSIVSDNQKMEDTDYSLRNGANQYMVRFARRATGADLVNIRYRGTAISFGPAGGKTAGVAKRPYSESQALSHMTYGEDCAVYQEVYAGVDLVYEVETHGVKENIVLKDATVQNEFVFDLKLRGLTPKEADGRLVFLDDEGDEVFHLGPMLALDEAGVPSEDVTWALVERGKKYQLMVTISKTYLDDPARVYPVIVDPSVMITGSGVTYDSFVSSRYPNNNYYLYNWLRTGRDTSYYTRRTFIRFNLSSLSGVDPDNITAAYIRIKKYSGATPTIRAYRVLGSWASSTITWNNKPGFSGTEYSTVAYNDSGSWWRMYNLTVAKKWLDGTYGQYGWMIMDSREYSTSIWTTFYSSDAPSPNKPELHIEYTAPPPQTTTTTAPPTTTTTLPPESLSPFPKYTYDTSGGTAVDPLNVYFAGLADDGYWGSAEGVGVSLNAYTSFFDPVAGDTQYVYFSSNWGNGQWREHPHQFADAALWGPRYHVRVFQDPYPALYGFAEKNCVGDIHHEDFNHDIDRHWETAEDEVCSHWDSDWDAFEIYPNYITNDTAGDFLGWYTDGRMTMCFLYP